MKRGKMDYKRKNAIITFDYEVFLGKETGSIEKSVLIPTEKILNILMKNSAKAIFFVDATWLLFLKNHFPEDLHTVSRQLKQIVSAGSSVELHLHPQWLDAVVQKGKIIFPTLKHYKLQSLDDPGILDLFDKSINLLQSITKQRISCFRAGGWCIEPFEKLEKAFERFKIKYDFSVLPGVTFKKGKDFDYDFNGIPELPFYRFNDDIFKPVRDGVFIEFPLSVYLNNPVYRIFNKLLLKVKGDLVYGDGVGGKVKTISQTILQALRFSKEKLSMDRTSLLIFKYLLIMHFRSQKVVTVVSHPKIMSHQTMLILEYLVQRYNTLSAQELDSFMENMIP